MTDDGSFFTRPADTPAAVVRDLAASDPLAEDRGYAYCTLCTGGPTERSVTDVVHEPTCPWLRAQSFKDTE